MAEKKKMTVAEILAAARAEKAGGGAAAAGDGVAPSHDAEQDKPEQDKAAGNAAGIAADSGGSAERADVAIGAASATPSGSPAPKPSKPGAGGRPSVAEIMALARANKGESGSGGAGVAKPAPAKPAPKADAKPAVKPVPKPAASGPTKGVARDTASILAAARGAKLGPVSKADASPAVKAKLAEAARGAPPGQPSRATAADGGKADAAKALAPKSAPPMPTRPSKPVAKGADDESDRRGFLSMAVGSFMALGFTALSVTGGLFTLGLARFLFPNVLAEPPSRFKVGFKEGFPAGKVETKYVAQYGVWVVNSDVGGSQQIYALKTVCTHLGCTPNWLEAEQKFKCPCHGSGFYKDGINFEGPAPRPLERYAIRVADDGQLEVDKSRAFQEELGQWNDPSSYVPV